MNTGHICHKPSFVYGILDFVCDNSGFIYDISSFTNDSLNSICDKSSVICGNSSFICRKRFMARALRQIGQDATGHIVSFNSRFRDRLLNRDLSLSINELEYAANRWRMRRLVHGFLRVVTLVPLLVLSTYSYSFLPKGSLWPVATFNQTLACIA